eukprot:TRINITY_DN46336_c0_g1_i1.p1 TRINITY_DN46336_c0_g1~~TRINITY_DN46336_c0_g1_i1.p1  ORF type:complete len:378 (-),score=28.86 TRINITY_DN46336_c0_g1_i1:125-1258(-)
MRPSIEGNHGVSSPRPHTLSLESAPIGAHVTFASVNTNTTVVASGFSCTLVMTLFVIHLFFYSSKRPSVFKVALYLVYGLYLGTANFSVANIGQASFLSAPKLVAPVFMTLIAKMVLFSTLLLAEDVPKGETRVCSRLRNACSTMLTLIVPDLLYAISDMIVVASQLTTIEVESVAKQSVIVTMSMWATICWNHRNPWKWTVLAACGIGAAAYLLPSRVQNQSFCFGACHSILLTQVIFSLAGGILLDHLLYARSSSEGPQRIAQCTWSALFFSIKSVPLPSILYRSFSWQNQVAVVAFAALGAAVACLLKYAGSVWKELAFGGIVLAHFLVEYISRPAEGAMWHVLFVSSACIGFACALQQCGKKPLEETPDEKNH